MKNKYYVYALLDPRKPGKYKYNEFIFDYEPFYIGKGCGNRMTHHFLKSSINLNPHSYKNNKIKKIIRDTNNPPFHMKIKQNITQQKALALETLLIKTIGRKDLKKGVLTNMTDGGEDRGEISPETRKKISQANKGQIPYIKGKHHSHESKRKISNNNAKYWLGKTYSDERKKQMSKITKQQDFSWRKKQYKLTNPNGETFIAIGLKSFCLQHNLTRSKITSVATGKAKQHKGWKCEYYNEP